MSFPIVRSVRSIVRPNSAAFFSSSSKWQINSTQIGREELTSTSTNTSTPIPKTQIDKPEDFINAIAKPRRGDLKSILTALGEESGEMKKLLDLDGSKLKLAGVPIKERRYFLWCLERFKQGQHPSEVAYDVKPKKKVRGWGARVQNGVRIRGMKRPGEK